MPPLRSQTVTPNPNTLARLRSPERNSAPAAEQPVSGGAASTPRQWRAHDTGNHRGRQAIANMAAAGGDDGELHVDEAGHLPWRVVSPRKPPPPRAPLGGGVGLDE